jgi:2-polyprenyl-3-methyl-5-hydroxy-6-metoxy-1,4-benzoquinol methylase
MEAVSPACPICGVRVQPFLGNLYDDRYGYPGLFSVSGCRGCGHRRLDAAFSPTELTRQYSDFYPRSTLNLDSFRPYTEARGRRAWLAGERASAYTWVPRNVRILDIGCGFGETLAYYKARGCDAHGIEADENIIRVGERYDLNVIAGLFDPKYYEPESFDYVTLDQVIEHVADPREFLAGVASVLKPGGVVILSTPNSRSANARLMGSKWINWHIPYHLQHFSKKSLRVLAKQNGLELTSIRTLTNSAWLRYQWLHMWSRPGPGQKSAFWDSERRGRTISRRLRRSSEILWRAKVFQAATRILDVFGLGDNYLCFLRKPL